MNETHFDHFRSRIDRLVDGDLTDFERRALLLDLETRPDGWRLCALTFLEAQEWRSSMGPAFAPKFSPRSSPSPSSAPVDHPGWFAPLMAWAAAVLVAFGLGWSASSRLRPETPQVVATRSDEPRPRSENLRPPSNESELARNGTTEPPSKPDSEPSPSQTILPAHVIGELQRAGYEVEPQRGFMPVRLRDGRIMDLPVEGVQIRQVNRKIL